MSEVRAIGVVGAGTMGAGIAQAAIAAGLDAMLHDPFPAALERGIDRIEVHLRRAVERGRLAADQAEAMLDRLTPCDSPGDLAHCPLIIEAIPEDPGLKHDLFARLAAECAPSTVLATNTSSLPITSIAASVPHPERVVGMHFFNPAPVMRLVEVIAGIESSAAALDIARGVARQMGKTPIDAADVPGFLVNRCGRPFTLEGLKLTQEQVADPPAIDRICRLGGGFRMGPFELADLIGVDVNFEVARSFYRLSFGEPRWRPSPLQARMVAAGRLGRKTGRGWYEYADGRPHRPADGNPLTPEGGSGVVALLGESRLAEELGITAEAAGYEVVRANRLGTRPAQVLIDARHDGGPVTVDDDAYLSMSPAPAAADAVILVLCAGASLATRTAGLDRRLRARTIGFCALPPLSESHLIELTRGDARDQGAIAAAQRFCHSIGKHWEWVDDAPGLVLGRIVCQLVNEAAFAVAEGVGGVEAVDQGVTLGLNYPRGTLAWADAIGIEHVLATLDGLYAEQRDDRYRAAPILRRMVAEGRLGRSAGGGFHAAG